MKMNGNELSKVAGGTAVEAKEGKWILTPPDAKTFDTKEAAEEAEKNFMKDHHHHGHEHHHCKHVCFMPPIDHMDPPPMGEEYDGPEKD